MKEKITKDTTLAKMLGNAELEKVLAKYNLPCLGCPFAQMEMDKLKLGDICKIYKINIKPLLTELNKLKS